MRPCLGFPRLLLACAGLLLAVAACTEPCVPGRAIECACDDGREGAQQCLSSHEYADCVCSTGGSGVSSPGQSTPGQSTPAQSTPGQGTPISPSRDGGIILTFPFDAGGASSAPGSTPRTDAGRDAALPSGVVAGDAVFVDLFVQGADLWVADSQGVSHVSLVDGHSIARWTAQRPLTAAAFDGAHLVALDGAKLTTLEPAALTVVAEGTLIESCADAVLVSGDRLVCGPNVDWDRVFYTYDALTGKLLASSAKYIYNGVPMRRVPGMDAFVTVSGGSPSDFHLFKVGADHVAVYLNESPYHGEFAAGDVFAFDGSPPQHLVNSQGLFLRFSLDCSLPSSSTMRAAGECFVKDGAVGTLTGSQSFSAMDNSGPVLTALVDPRGANSFPSSTPTANNYLLQTIDLPSRLVLSQQVVALPSGRLLGFRASLDQKRVAVVIGKSTSSSSFDPPAAGYDILRFELP